MQDINALRLSKDFFLSINMGPQSLKSRTRGRLSRHESDFRGNADGRKKNYSWGTFMRWRTWKGHPSEMEGNFREQSTFVKDTKNTNSL